jgi:hypothetical protein
LNKPAAADEAAFQRAVDDVAKATEILLGALPSRGPVRTREHEREKARVRWNRRVTAMTPRNE